MNRIMRQNKGYEKIVLICLEILIDINKIEVKKEKIYKEMDRIRDIIVEDMNVNKDEEHSKVIKYLNKIAKLCYSDENEDRFIISILLHTLTYKLKGKEILVKIDWLKNVVNKYKIVNFDKIRLSR